MKNYSTLLLSSTLFLASLATGPVALAEDVEKEVGQSSIVDKSPENTALTEPNSPLSTQQDGDRLSIFYQRSEQQQNHAIHYAIWSDEGGQDDLQWYRAGDYQTDISLANSKAGQYTVHSYISIDDQTVFLEESSLTLTKAPPSITTSLAEQGILDITVHNIAPDVQTVLLPIWSNENGQDDLRWYTANRQADGRYTLRVYLKDHQFATGPYSIHLYTRNSQGKQSFVTKIETSISAQDVPSKSLPSIAIENIQAQAGKYQVSVQETATSKVIQSVSLASWSMDKQGNLKWRTAKLVNGKYQVTVDFREQQNHSGIYQNHVYITYTDGSRVGYVADTVDLTSARLPVSFSSKATSTGYVQVNFSNIYSNEPVSYAVWSDENGQDDLKWYKASQSADKTYTGSIPLANHLGVGKYHVHAYQGNKGLGAFSMTVTSAQRYTSPNTYPIGECTWGVKEQAGWIGNYWGNAGQWAASARAAGFRTGSTPQVGAVAVWTDGGYGHVALVTAVESRTRIRVKECNYAGKRYIGDFRGWFNPVSDGVTAYIYPN